MSDEMVRQYLQRDGGQSKLILLVNPFTRLAGWPALGLGLLVVAATMLVAVVGSVHFDGVMDVHLAAASSSPALALEPLLDWLVVALLFLVAGLVWARGPQRVMEYFAMSAVGRLPFLLAGLLWSRQGLGGAVGVAIGQVTERPPALPSLGSMPGLPWLVVGGVLTIAVMLWGLFLNFFALREASGMPTGRAVGAYVAVIVVGEIVSKLLVGLVLPHLAG